MNAKAFSQRDYEKKSGFAVQENKPKQSQSGNRSQKTKVRSLPRSTESTLSAAERAQGGLRVCSWCVLYRVIGNRYDVGSV